MYIYMYVCVHISLYLYIYFYSLTSLLHHLFYLPSSPSFLPSPLSPLLYSPCSLLSSVFSFASSLCSFLQCPMFISSLVHSLYFIVLLTSSCGALSSLPIVFVVLYVWCACSATPPSSLAYCISLA